MAKKPPSKLNAIRPPNIIIDRIPDARRSAIKRLCAECGTSIEKIPDWMLGLPVRKLRFRLNLAAGAAKVIASDRSKSNSRASKESWAKVRAKARAKAEADAVAKAKTQAEAKKARAVAKARVRAEAGVKAKGKPLAGKAGADPKPSVVAGKAKMSKARIPLTEIKIPNTPTGQRAVWWLKNVVSRVGNTVKKQRMRRLIFDNAGLSLPEFERIVEKKIDEMNTEKKKSE